MSGLNAEQDEHDQRQSLRQRRMGSSSRSKAGAVLPSSPGGTWGVPDKEASSARWRSSPRNNLTVKPGKRRPSLFELQRPADGVNSRLGGSRKDGQDQELESPLDKIDSLGTLQTGLITGPVRRSHGMPSSSSGGLPASASNSPSNSRRGSGSRRGSRRGSRLALGVDSGDFSALAAKFEGSKEAGGSLGNRAVRYSSLGDQLLGELLLYIWAIIFSRVLAVVPSIASWAAESEAEDETEREAIRLFEEGRYELSLTKHLALLKAIERQHGKDSIMMARACHSTGKVYAKMEKWDAAVSQFTRSMLLFETVEGEESEGATGVQVSLGNALQQEGKLSRALAELEQARDAFVMFHLRKEEEDEEEGGGGGEGGAGAGGGAGRIERDVKQRLDAIGGQMQKKNRLTLEFARTVNEIGIVCFKQGDVRRSKVELEEALRLFESVSSTASVEVAHTRCQLGRVLLNLGNTDAAAQHYMSALKIYQELGLGDTESAGAVHSDLGLVHWNQSRYGEACDCFGRSIAVFEHVLGGDHVKVANARAERGTMLVRLGRHGEAVAEYENAIHICSKRLGRKHAMIAHLKGQIGLALLNGGDPDKAMEAFQEAKHMFSARFGEDSEKVVTVMSYIGSTLVRLGRHEEALDEYRKAADAIGRRQSGGLVLADVLNQCGVCCWMCDRLDDALDFYTEALDIYVSKLGNGSEQAASTMYNIGVVYHRMKMHEKARGYYKLVLEAYSRIPGGHFDSNIADLHNRMGVSYSSQGLDSQAQDEFMSALEYFSSSGRKEPGHAFTLRELGALCLRAGRYEEAQQHYKSSLALLEDLGTDQLAAANLENEMGLLHWRKGSHDEALRHYHKALAIYVELGGEECSEVACCRNNVGAVYQKQELLDKALSEYKAALSIYTSQLGADHVLSASTVNNIAMVYQRQGQLDKAVSQYEIALAMYEKRGSKGAVDAAGTKVSIAKVRKDQGEYRVAAEMFEECVAVFRKEYGKRNVTVASAMVHLGECLDALGDVDGAQHLFRSAASTYKAVHGKSSAAYRAVKARIHKRLESESPMVDRRGRPMDDASSPETPARKHSTRHGSHRKEKQSMSKGGGGGGKEAGDEGRGREARGPNLSPSRPADATCAGNDAGDDDGDAASLS